MKVAPSLILVTVAGVLALENYYPDYRTSKMADEQAEEVSAIKAENALENAIAGALDYLDQNDRGEPEPEPEPKIQIIDPEVHNYVA